ncbi:hypothetical protein ACFY19_32320 [Streptosporangium saharense]|uniref:hypothetical protein n=1 Tax=Streptosporangium saharense TaxID=1706840 RepID=UPI0036B42928
MLDPAHTCRSGLGGVIGWPYGVARDTLSAQRRTAASRPVACEKLTSGGVRRASCVFDEAAFGNMEPIG